MGRVTVLTVLSGLFRVTSKQCETFDCCSNQDGHEYMLMYLSLRNFLISVVGFGRFFFIFITSWCADNVCMYPRFAAQDSWEVLELLGHHFKLIVHWAFIMH